MPLQGIDAAVEEGARLPAFARGAGMPVIHVIHHGRPGAAAFDPAGDGAGFIQDLVPVEAETVLVKSRPNAFAGTDLVAGATATRDLPHPFGAGITPAEIIQAATLAALSDRFSVVIQDTGALSRPAWRTASAISHMPMQ